MMLNPGAGESRGNGHQPGDLTAAEAAEAAEPGLETAPLPDLPEGDLAEDLTAEEVEREVRRTPASEVVEEYIDE